MKRGHLVSEGATMGGEKRKVVGKEWAPNSFSSRLDTGLLYLRVTVK